MQEIDSSIKSISRNLCNTKSDRLLGRIVADEWSRKLEVDVVLTWDELQASDLAGRARAFQSMVGGGMAKRAAALAGLMAPEDD